MLLLLLLLALAPALLLALAEMLSCYSHRVFEPPQPLFAPPLSRQKMPGHQ
jgi:hypothetical protein